jgi:hypothetical protein
MARRKTTAARVAGEAAAQTALARSTSTSSTPQTSTPPASSSSATLSAAELVSVVHRWILDGQSEHDIRHALATDHQGAEATPLIVAAVERFHESGKFEPEIMLGWCYEAYRDIYRQAKDAGDLATAIRAVKSLAQLAGFK